MVNRNLGLVFHVAREISAAASSVASEELLGAGTLGLLQAAKNFDPDRGVRFSSFAVPRIRGAMLDALRAEDSVPRNRRRRARQLQRARDTLAGILHRPPTRAEMARALGLDDASYAHFEQSASADVLSLHDLDVRDDNGHTWAAQQPGRERDVSEWDIETRLTVRQALHGLPATERAVVELYYLRGLRMWQVGNELDITESQVSKLCKKAVHRLRGLVAERPSNHHGAAPAGGRSTAGIRALRRRVRRGLGDTDLPSDATRGPVVVARCT